MTMLATVLGAALLASTIEIGPADDVEAAMNALAPGDELVLRGGTYELSGRFSATVVGTSALPIVVRAKDGERPHLHRAAADQNIVDLDHAEYLTIRGVEFSGGSAGLRLSQVSYLTLEECEIHDTDDVALRANDSGIVYESLTIRRNELHHTSGTGEGMYLGCNSNACRVRNSLIERNYVHHTNQASVTQGDGIELKEGSSGNVIRDNVIHDTNYPCILVYSTVGEGPANRIERNVMWGCGDHAIQAAADAVIQNNILLGAAADGIAMQPHQAGTPSGLVVVHNTVLNAGGHAISLRGATGNVVIANNGLFSQSASALYVGTGTLTGVVVVGNVGQGGVSGLSATVAAATLTAFAGASYAGAPPMDVFPAGGGALVGSGSSAHLVSDDFNGTARGTAADVGAYAFSAGGNPGWTLSAAFKGVTTGPQSDGGDPDGGDSDGGSADGGDADGGDDSDADADAGAGAGGDGSDAGAGQDAGSEGVDELPGEVRPIQGGCDCSASTDGALVALVGALFMLMSSTRRRTPRSGARR